MKTAHTTAVLAILLAAPAALGQATTDDEAAQLLEGVPGPAIERLRPRLDTWWQRSVFYELFVRSFADSTEGPLAGDGIGDLRGIIEHLDYLNDGDPATDTDLGVTALWLMPINPSPSYHGYNVTDYYDINPDYGTMDDFKELLAECHKRGVRVITDLVLNHSASEHPWFQASVNPDAPERDWYIWVDEKPDWKGAWGQPVWHESPAGDGTYFFGMFHGGMPDLNYRSEGATRAAYDITRFWLEDVGVDGFRLDAIRHLIEHGRVQDSTPETHAWLADWYRYYKSVNPEAFTVGEVWSNSDSISRYVGDQIDVCFEFPLAYTIVESVQQQTSEHVERSIKEINELYPTGMYASFVRNHDQPRTCAELNGDIEAAKLAAIIQFALPGVPFVYYGEEIGAIGAGDSHEDVRTPMAWDPRRPGVGFTTGAPWADPGRDVLRRNVESMQKDPGSILNTFKQLIRVRAEHDCLRESAVRAVDTGDARIMMLQRMDGAAVTCTMLFNLSSEPQRIPRDVSRHLVGDVIFRTGPRVRPDALPPRGSIWVVPAEEEPEGEPDPHER